MISTHGCVQWLVKPIGFQALIRRCPKCALKRHFFPGGTFRVNAQKKTLDIWSIYKCEICDYTWNIDIVSRVNISRIDHALYERFLSNDHEEICRRAFDYNALLRTNNVLGPPPDFDVEGDEITTLPGTPQLEVNIQLQYPIQVRLVTILAKKLNLSRSRIVTLAAAGVISGVSGRELNRKARPVQMIALDVAGVMAARTACPLPEPEGDHDVSGPARPC
ncbi:DUF1062 domain-containing protein [Acerihabitans sp. KWT182]|uniref:DUF1062 domain-containing protein n=1 Tax=Acerihabitans sp. KWT182 TaxID=3157919 RepID=A0AAU7Q4M0_9GAMM